MDETCVISNRKVSSGKARFTMTCKQGSETWRSELTTARDSFVFQMMDDETIDGLTVGTQITARGKRTGDCGK
jgi:hypothetical protein